MNITKFELDTVCEELKALFVEAEFSSRWTILEAYHQAGEMILKTYGRPDNPLTKEDLVQAIAGKLGKGERTLWYAVKFYETYPDLQRLPEGKNTSWNKIIKKYLTAGKGEELEHEHTPIVVCKICKKLILGMKIEKIESR